MSYSYELDTAQTLLPGFYNIDVTATATGYTPLTRSFSIEVDAVQVGDIVRTLVDLLTNIWRDGQGPKQLTAQDVRDTIVSLALQTGDFSNLPTSQASAAFGHAYIESSVVKVRLAGTGLPQSASATLAGATLLSARVSSARQAAKATFSGSASLGGGTGGEFSGEFTNEFTFGSAGAPDATVVHTNQQGASAALNGSGKLTAAAVVRQRATATLAGTATLGQTGPFSAEFSTEFHKGTAAPNATVI